MSYSNSVKGSKRFSKFSKIKLFAYGIFVIALTSTIIFGSFETFGATEYFMKDVIIDEEGFKGYTIIAEKDEVVIENVSIVAKFVERVFIIENPKKITISGVVSSQDSTVRNLILLDYRREVESVEITIKDSKIYTYDKEMIDFLVMISEYTKVYKLIIRIINSTIVGDVMIFTSLNKMDVNVEIINSEVRSNIIPSCNVSALFYRPFSVKYTIRNSTISSPNAPEKSVYYDYEYGEFVAVEWYPLTTILPRRILENEYDKRSALIITLTTIFLTSLGVYIEHVYRKKEKIEEILGE